MTYRFSLFTLIFLIATLLVGWLSWPKTKMLEVKGFTSFSAPYKFNINLTTGLRIPGFLPSYKIADIQAELNGNQSIIPPEAWFGLNGFNPDQEPQVVEERGYPTLLLKMTQGEETFPVYWQFMNGSFSGRIVNKPGDYQSKLFASTWGKLETLPVVKNSSVGDSTISIPASAVKKLTPEQIKAFQQSSR